MITYSVIHTVHDRGVCQVREEPGGWGIHAAGSRKGFAEEMTFKLGLKERETLIRHERRPGGMISKWQGVWCG